jgi:hypothetical protein
MKLLMSLLLLFLLSVPALAQTTGIAWVSNGWVLTATYTNPAPVATTKVGDILAGITYQKDGVPQTTPAASETITILAPSTTTTKIWTSTNVLNTGFTISEVTGDGTAAFDATGHLVFKVNAPNDGAIHTLKFKLKSTLPIWMVQYVPWVKQYLASKLVILPADNS